MKLATNISRENIISIGTCFGKFTKSGKFHLHITAIDYISQYAKYKVWVKPGNLLMINFFIHSEIIDIFYRNRKSYFIQLILI